MNRKERRPRLLSVSVNNYSPGGDFLSLRLTGMRINNDRIEINPKNDVAA